MSLLTPMKVLTRQARSGDGATMPGPYRIAAAHRPTLFGKLAMERWIAWSRSVDDRLKTLAELRVSSIIGCMW